MTKSDIANKPEVKKKEYYKRQSLQICVCSFTLMFKPSNGQTFFPVLYKKHTHTQTCSHMLTLIIVRGHMSASSLRDFSSSFI